jgi:hypothetical protein
VEGIKKSVNNYFELFQNNKLQVEATATAQFSRKNLAKKYMKLIEK